MFPHSDIHINICILRITLWGKKLHPYYFCNNFCQISKYFHKFWHTDTLVNLQQNCNKIDHHSWWLFSPYLVKQNVSQFVHDSSIVSFKVMTVTYHRETHHSKCSECLLLSLRHAIKQCRHWSIDWSMKLCWLLTIFQSDAISAHGHTSLVSYKHVPAFRFYSVTPGSGELVWFSCSQGWKWMMHRTITVMSCCSNSCCHTSFCQDAGDC